MGGCFTGVNELYGDIKKIGAALYLYKIGFVDTVTLEMKNKYAIFIDRSKFSSNIKLKEAVAHEIGHCATGCTHKISSSLDLIEKHEYKANRWMVEKYLPFDDLNAAMKSGYTEIWELADYFDVSEDFIKKAISYYTEKCGRHFE